MRKTTYTNIFRAMALICTLFSSSLFADNASKFIETDYQKLCDIYKNIVDQPLDLTSKEMNLTDNVKNKLPKLFNDLFIHIIRTNADSRYQLIKQYAKQQNDIIWECEIARLYYTNEFAKP